MATNVIMPALGMNQETGTLVRWLKRAGEMVSRGEPLMEVETDKVLVEVEAAASGILADVVAQEGDEVPVGQVIARILEPAEVGPPSQPLGRLGASPSPARGEGDSASPHGRGRPRQSARTGEGASSKTLASPRARRLAAEAGLELRSMQGTGPEGAVLAADVLAARPAPERELVEAAPAAGPEQQPAASSVAPVSRAWRVMAERMVASWTTAPQFALVREARADALVEMRTRIAAAAERQGGVRPTYTDLLVKIVATVLRRHPRVNARWTDGEIRESVAVNIGIATATAEALLVPVIPEADTLTVGEIAARRQDLVERAGAGTLTPAGVSGATFTLSNLGMHGVDAFTAIVVPGQAAILAVGRIADRVVSVDGGPAVRPTLILTLSCDHRVVDGARAAPFLEDVAALIEEPWGLLI